jgi:hypothetical protein
LVKDDVGIGGDFNNIASIADSADGDYDAVFKELNG